MCIGYLLGILATILLGYCQCGVKPVIHSFILSGIEYNVVRIPMASCDFSTHPYSYDDSPMDFSLSKFALAKEDLVYKVCFTPETLVITLSTHSHIIQLQIYFSCGHVFC